MAEIVSVNATNWSMFMLKTIFNIRIEEIIVEQLSVFCAFMVVVFLFTSSINLFFHSNKTETFSGSFCLYLVGNSLNNFDSIASMSIKYHWIHLYVFLRRLSRLWRTSATCFKDLLSSTSIVTLSFSLYI